MAFVMQSVIFLVPPDRTGASEHQHISNALVRVLVRASVCAGERGPSVWRGCAAVHRSAWISAVGGGGVCPQSRQRARATSNMANECMSEYRDE